MTFNFSNINPRVVLARVGTFRSSSIIRVPSLLRYIHYKKRHVASSDAGALIIPLVPPPAERVQCLTVSINIKQPRSISELDLGLL